MGKCHEVGKRAGIAVGTAALMMAVLPLANHSHPLVVDDEDLDRQRMLHRGCKFLDVHLNRRFAGDVDDQRFGMRDLRADRGGKTIAHRAKAAARQPPVGCLEADVLCRPNLMLADLGRNDRRPGPVQCMQSRDGVLGQDGSVILSIVQASARLPAGDDALPVVQASRTPWPGRCARADASPTVIDKSIAGTLATEH